MSEMFYGCKKLGSLNLSETFLTTDADTMNMFDGCPASSDWWHLLYN
jgi:hypothetical protein